MSKLIEPFRFRIGDGPVVGGFAPVALPPDVESVVHELTQTADFTPGDWTGEMTIQRGPAANDADFFQWVAALGERGPCPVIYHQPDGTEVRGHVHRIRHGTGVTHFDVRLDPTAAENAAAEAAFGGEDA